MIQHGKSAYCEKKLEQSGIVQDMDHYRPKGAIRVWPPPRKGFSYDFPTGGASEIGFLKLAYHRSNFAVACKTSNTLHKSNFFPVASARNMAAADLAVAAAEEPLLVMPVGEQDPDDPEDLITFVGVIAIPRQTEGRTYRRARVTNDLLALIRDELLRGRCEVVRNVYASHQAEKLDPVLSRQAQTTLIATFSPHANCARRFDALCRSDWPAARSIATEAIQQLSTIP